MKITASLVLASAFFLAPGLTNATDYVSVGQMLMDCQKPDGHFLKTRCFTYVGAVLDVQDQFALSDRSGTKLLCVPPEVLARQAAAVFVQWAETNPAQHHIPAASGVIESLVGAFPCRWP